MLPSPDDTAPGHPGPEVTVSIGSARESFAPIGSNLPDYDNYFCRDCRRIVYVRKGSPGFRACPRNVPPPEDRGMPGQVTCSDEI